MLLRTNREELLSQVLDMFGRSVRRVRIYLAVDGKRNVGEIAHDEHIWIKNVYNELKKLKEWSLVVIKGERNNQLIFRKGKLERILNLSRVLRGKFNLD